METAVLGIRKFPVELHKKVKAAAANEGVSLQEWFVKACEEKLAKEKDSK